MQLKLILLIIQLFGLGLYESITSHGGMQLFILAISSIAVQAVDVYTS